MLSVLPKGKLFWYAPVKKALFRAHTPVKDVAAGLKAGSEGVPVKSVLSVGLLTMPSPSVVPCAFGNAYPTPGM